MIKDDLAAIERLINRKQAVPSQLIRSLLTACRSLTYINEQQSKEIAKLKQSPEEYPPELYEARKKMFTEQIEEINRD